MPVRIVAAGEPAGTLTLSADGAVPVTLRLTGARAEVLVPLLVVRQPLGPLKWTFPDGRAGSVGTNLIALGDQERLVGFSGTRGLRQAALFNGAATIPVPLDLAEPLPGNAALWEALDAVELDTASDGPRFDALLGAGLTVVVRTEVSPAAGGGTWKRVADAWVATRESAGLRGVMVPEAYTPLYGWKAGRPALLRRQAVLGAAVFAILVSAMSLWKSPRAVVAIVLTAAIGTAAAVAWSRRQPTTVTAGGAVVVRREGVSQADRWTYLKSVVAAADFRFPADGVKPIFASTSHFERAVLRLECDVNGDTVGFAGRLPPGGAIAFRTREWIATQSLPTPDPSARASPLWPLARDAYFPPGPSARAAGEVPPTPTRVEPEGMERWPGVVIDSAP